MLHAADSKTLFDANIVVERDFDFLSEEYVALYARSNATAFQAPIWMDKIHRMLVPNLNATSFTITVRHRADDALLAVFPFVKQHAAGITIVQPADFGVCDYNAIVAPNEILEVIAHSSPALEMLSDLIKTASLFLFRKVREDGFDITRLFPDAASSCCENAAYHCDIAGSLEEWERETLGRKMMKDLRRKVRQMETLYGPSPVRVVTSEDEIVAAFEFIKQVRKTRYEGDLLQNQIYFDFYRAYALAAAASGEAAMHVKYVGDAPVSALFGLLGDGDFHGVLIAADIANFSKYSLGVQIFHQTISDQFVTGSRHFDFCLGEANYKSHFRVEPTILNNFTIANNLAGMGVAMVYNHAKPIKNIARKLVPNLH